MLNIKDALYSGIHTVQENAKKINETVAPGIVHGIETAATKTGDALTAGKNTVVNTGAAAKDAVMDQLDANHDGKVDIEDIIILGLRTPGVKVERNRFLANEFRAHYDAATIEKAVRTTPMKAGISLEEINKIADANAFVQSMKAHYNFLPNYEFSDLAHGEHPFWLGMKMDDFYLIYNHENKMVGIYGLWNQQSFKQTKVVHYSWLLKLIRPFYNLYAGVKGALVLPKKERAFDYLMLHSALCHPSDKGVFNSLLFHAQEQTRLKRKNAFCITLAKTDPRIYQMSHTSSQVIHAIHAFHSFQGKPYELFDGSKISYFETGRI